MGRSYSQRLAAERGERERLSKGFWHSFHAVLTELAEKNYFCEQFAGECSDGHPYGWWDKAVQQKLETKLGKIDWPISKENPPNDETILDLVEFFFQFISEPQETWFHPYCGMSHPKSFDQKNGRYAYTIKVNDLFHAYNQPFKLSKGAVLKQSSTVLDAILVQTNIGLPVDDNHLEELIAEGLNHFYKGQRNHKMDGLRSIVGAYERLKTLMNSSDKKKSTHELIKKLAFKENLTKHLDALFKELTKISNDNTIRHHEYGTEIIDDEDTIEFLFYAYYNVVRFILSSLSK